MIKMDEHILFTIINVIAGIMIALTLCNYLPGTTLRTAKDAIEECEKNLPRNQHCIINAIPKSKNEQ